jgi:hypothetical protein
VDYYWPRPAKERIAELEVQVAALGKALNNCLGFLRSVEWDDRAAAEAENLSEEADAALTVKVSALIDAARKGREDSALLDSPVPDGLWIVESGSLPTQQTWREALRAAMAAGPATADKAGER